MGRPTYLYDVAKWGEGKGWLCLCRRGYQLGAVTNSRILLQARFWTQLFPCIVLHFSYVCPKVGEGQEHV